MVAGGVQFVGNIKDRLRVCGWWGVKRYIVRFFFLVCFSLWWSWDEEIKHRSRVGVLKTTRFDDNTFIAVYLNAYICVKYVNIDENKPVFYYSIHFKLISKFCWTWERKTRTKKFLFFLIYQRYNGVCVEPRKTIVQPSSSAQETEQLYRLCIGAVTSWLLVSFALCISSNFTHLMFDLYTSTRYTVR